MVVGDLDARLREHCVDGWSSLDVLIEVRENFRTGGMSEIILYEMRRSMTAMVCNRVENFLGIQELCQDFGRIRTRHGAAEQVSK